MATVSTSNSTADMEVLSADPDQVDKGTGYRTLAGLLRRCNFKHADKRIGYFWSDDLLQRIMTKERIVAALLKEGLGLDSSRSEELAGEIRQRYVKVFALLLLVSRGSDIVKLMDDNVCDEILPLHYKFELEDPGLYRDGSNDAEPIRCFAVCEWLPHEMDFFYNLQWRLKVPYFSRSMDEQGLVDHHDLAPQTILPWCRTITANENEMVKMTGGYGTVERVRMHPSCHGLGEFLNKLCLPDHYFAVKSTQSNDREHFKNEVETLKYLGQAAHPNLLNILATFSWNGADHILLPYAKCNLWEFWQTHPGPLAPESENPRDDMSWVASQNVGIVSGLNFLHEHDIRHGDIKPDNILCFESNVVARRTLVLADFGLSKVHEVLTGERRQPTTTHVETLVYRAPESDMRSDNQARSRRYDIWSLGCVFLEMAAWILGDLRGLEMARMQKGYRDPFFEVIPSETPGAVSDSRRRFRVHIGVREFIAYMYDDHRCTTYMRKFLGIIQHDMLLIGLDQRIGSQALLLKLEEIQMEWSNDLSFLMEPLQDSVLVEPALPADPILAEYDDKTSWINDGAYRRLLSSVNPSGTYRDSLGSKRLIERGNNFFPSSELNTRSIGMGQTGVLHSITEPKSGAGNETTRADQPTRDLVQEIDETVRQALSKRSGGDVHEVAFKITCQLQQCVLVEMDGDCDLDPVLTISGNPSHSWAVSCREYVERTWSHVGVQFLQDLKIHLRNRGQPEAPDAAESGMECNFCPIEEEATRPTFIKYRGTIKEISILSQVLCWIMATFRLPKERQMSSSLIEFVSTNEEVPTFLISLQDLTDLPKAKRGTCWKALFPSSVMAFGFPAHEIPGTFGLQILLDGMLKMANILDEVNLEDDKGQHRGVYFDGTSYALYATDYIDKENTVQWHMTEKPKGRERDQAVAPDLNDSGQAWARDIPTKILINSKAVLGYCDEVKMQLGTSSRQTQFNHFRYSMEKLEKPPMEINLASLTLGFSKSGVIGGSIWNVKEKQGLKSQRQGEALTNYQLDVDRAKNDFIILLETSPGKERAWLVPKLSMVLELYNYWATKMRLQDIKYANASPNDGSAAITVLEDKKYVQRPALEGWLTGDDTLQVGHVVIAILNRIDQRIVTNSTAEPILRGAIRLGSSVGIVGWDWLELAGGEPPVTERRQFTKFPSNPCWAQLINHLKLPVFMGENLGQLFTPARPGELCDHWRTIPGGVNNSYLVACLSSINKLFTRTVDEFRFGDQVWELKDRHLFGPCNNRCRDDAGQCQKKPQCLVYKKPKPPGQRTVSKFITALPRLRRNNIGNLAPAEGIEINTEAAVVFAEKRKHERDLRPNDGQVAPLADPHEAEAQQDNAPAVGIQQQDNLQGANAQGDNVQGADPPPQAEIAQEAAVNIPQDQVEEADVHEARAQMGNAPVVAAQVALLQEGNMQGIMVVLAVIVITFVSYLNAGRVKHNS